MISAKGIENVKEVQEIERFLKAHGGPFNAGVVDIETLDLDAKEDIFESIISKL